MGLGPRISFVFLNRHRPDPFEGQFRFQILVQGIVVDKQLFQQFLLCP